SLSYSFSLHDALPVCFRCARVCLKRDLRIGQQIQIGPKGGEHLVDGAIRQQTGGAPSNENGDDLPAPDQRQRLLEIGLQRLQVRSEEHTSELQSRENL